VRKSAARIANHSIQSNMDENQKCFNYFCMYNFDGVNDLPVNPCSFAMLEGRRATRQPMGVRKRLISVSQATPTWV
jgi:hypothetical protein